MNQTKLIDSFGRPHNYLRISLTDRCNLRCFYCMPEDGIELEDRRNIMSIEEIIGIAETFISLGVDTIRFTGGEPLVRKNFETVVRSLAHYPIKMKLTTNGIVLDQYFDLLEEIGLKSINISLDSLDHDTSVAITKRDYFDRIMRNLNEAIRRKFDIKINVVLIKGINDKEIADFIGLTQNHPVTVKFIEFMPFKDNQWDWEKGVSKEEILKVTKSQFGTFHELPIPAHSTSTPFQVEGFQGTFGIVSTVTAPFCESCNRIRLTANGRIKNCLFSHDEIDLLTPYRKGEDIEPLIINSLQKKKFSRAGMETFDQFSDPSLNGNNRSMVAIGG